MANKNPAFQFYPNDWSRDLEDHPLEIEGAWIRLCCKLWWSDTRGQMTRSLTQWARILRENEEAASRILNYISEQKIGDMKLNGNGDVTVISRRMVNDEKIRNQTKLRVQRHREKQPCNADVTHDVTPMKHCSSSSSSSSCTKVQQDTCPQKGIVGLWLEVLPELPQPKDWGPERQSLLKARWHESEERQSLDWWEKLFEYIRKCPFLMGDIDPAPDRKRFFASLPWVLKKANFLKIIEGNYDHD